MENGLHDKCEELKRLKLMIMKLSNMEGGGIVNHHTDVVEKIVEVPVYIEKIVEVDKIIEKEVEKVVV